MVSHSLNPNDFYKKLIEDDFNGTEYTINFEVVINNEIVDWHYKVIKKIVFREVVRISSVEINSGLAFINCEFKKGIVFRGVHATNFNSTINPNNACVLFSNCSGSHIVFNDGCFFERGIVLDNNSKFDKLLIYNTEVGNGGITVDNCEITKLLDISHVNSELRLQNATITKTLRLESVTGDISSVSSSYGDFVRLWNVECPISFTLNDNVFHDTFKIEASRIRGFFIHRDVFNKQFELENRDMHGTNKSSCEEVFITGAKFIEGADFNGLGEPIKKITLRLSPGFGGVLNFDNWKVDDLQVSGINQNLKLLFNRMIFRFVLFNNFTNYGDLSFVKCSATSDSPLNLINTDLGAAKFNEFDLSSFELIRIDNVLLDKIKASNVKWFENNKLEIGSDLSELDKQRGIREVSRQLKHALTSSGNQIDSLLFKAREMQAYRNELKNSGKNYKPSERLVLTVSRTNNFGLSWWKPTWIIFLITLGFYLIMLPLFSKEIFYNMANSMEEVKTTLYEFWNNFNVFWQLFNPARRFSTVYGNIDSSWLQFLDLLQRVILGVFIYQIISGFRKLTSK